MNNLSEKLEELVKKDTMKYMYGGKKTLFTETGIKQLYTKETKKKYQEAFDSIMKSNQTKKYFKNLSKNQMALAIHTIDVHITSQLLENTKYIIT